MVKIVLFLGIENKVFVVRWLTAAEPLGQVPRDISIFLLDLLIILDICPYLLKDETEQILFNFAEEAKVLFVGYVCRGLLAEAPIDEVTVDAEDLEDGEVVRGYILLHLCMRQKCLPNNDAFDIVGNQEDRFLEEALR